MAPSLSSLRGRVAANGEDWVFLISVCFRALQLHHEKQGSMASHHCSVSSTRMNQRTVGASITTNIILRST